MRICVITYYYEVVVGPGTQLCTLLEVWVLGVGMSTFDAQSAVRRGSGSPSTGDPRPIRVDHTNCLQVANKTHSFIRQLGRMVGG